MAEQYEAVRQTLLQRPGIEHVTRSSVHPLSVAIKNANVIWEGKELEENILFTVLRTDDHFASTMKLNLASGRYFELMVLVFWAVLDGYSLSRQPFER